MSEKWFHNLNSQNKFSPNRQNKTFKLCTNCFSFPNGRTNHVTSGHLPMFSTVRTVLLRPQSSCRQKIMFTCASACANAIQTKPHRLKLLILYSTKFHRTKVQSSEKMEKRATFLTLGRVNCPCPEQGGTLNSQLSSVIFAPIL